MSKFCTHCGAENSDDAYFCKACGAPLEPAKPPAPPLQQYATPVYGQPMYQPSPDMMLYSNLQSLRSAFFWMFLGLILSIIPVVNIVGAIILFIAFILLILGFGKVANTGLPHAAQYRSTKNWLLISLIVGIVLGAVTVIIIIEDLLIYSGSLSVSTATSISKLLVIGIWSIVAIIIFTITDFIIYIITYLKVVNSLKSLSVDLSVQRLKKAGNLLFYALIITIVGELLIPLFLYIDVFISLKTAALNSLNSIYSMLAILAVPMILIVVAYILEIISFYNAYTGIDEFNNRPRAIPAVSNQQYPPPQQPEPPKFTF
ncbi:MAG: zinc-ribbon domain-containing protein [Thermoplasmata archaeon]